MSFTGQNPRQMVMCPFTNFFCPCMESCPQNGYGMGYCFMRSTIKCCPVWVVNLCARSRTMVDPWRVGRYLTYVINFWSNQIEFFQQMNFLKEMWIFFQREWHDFQEVRKTLHMDISIPLASRRGKRIMTIFYDKKNGISCLYKQRSFIILYNIIHDHVWWIDRLGFYSHRERLFANSFRWPRVPSGTNHHQRVWQIE